LRPSGLGCQKGSSVVMVFNELTNPSRFRAFQRSLNRFGRVLARSKILTQLRLNLDRHRHLGRSSGGRFPSGPLSRPASFAHIVASSTPNASSFVRHLSQFTTGESVGHIPTCRQRLRLAPIAVFPPPGIFPHNASSFENARQRGWSMSIAWTTIPAPPFSVARFNCMGKTPL